MLMHKVWKSCAGDKCQVFTGTGKFSRLAVARIAESKSSALLVISLAESQENTHWLYFSRDFRPLGWLSGFLVMGDWSEWLAARIRQFVGDQTG